MAKAAGKASVGKRDNQEDSFRLEFENRDNAGSDVLMVLSDGMGGHAGGEVASDLVCSVFAEHFIRKSQETRPKSRLNDALQIANAALGQSIAASPELKGMGCTLIGALKIGDRLVWTSVGDSILFLLRDGVLRRLNADHSLYGELIQLVKDGKLSQAEADANPRRNALRSAVLGGQIALIDTKAVELRKGDLVLLATDGLETLPDAEIETIMSRHARPDVRAVASDLLNAVERKDTPNQDNTTVIVYHHTDDGVTSNRGMTHWSSMVSEEKAARALWSKVPYWIGGAVAAVLLLGMVIWVATPGDPPPVVVATPPPVAPDNQIGQIGTPEGDSTTVIEDNTTPQEDQQGQSPTSDTSGPTPGQILPQPVPEQDPGPGPEQGPDQSEIGGEVPGPDQSAQPVAGDDASLPDQE